MGSWELFVCKSIGLLESLLEGIVAGDHIKCTVTLNKSRIFLGLNIMKVHN